MQGNILTFVVWRVDIVWDNARGKCRHDESELIIKRYRKDRSKI